MVNAYVQVSSTNVSSFIRAGYTQIEREQLPFFVTMHRCKKIWRIDIFSITYEIKIPLKRDAARAKDKGSAETIMDFQNKDTEYTQFI